MAAICLCCGFEKSEPLQACPSCSFEPVGRDRAISWLCSDAHLSPAELVETAGRISAGEPPNPASSLIHRANIAIGLSPEKKNMPIWVLGLGNLLLTPLFGFAIWLDCRHQNYKYASYVARTTIICATFSSFVFVSVLLFSRW